MFDKTRKGAFLLMLAGLAVATSTASTAGAESSRPVQSITAPDRARTPDFTWENWLAPQVVLLYNQLDNDGATANTSQNFEAVYDAYDTFLGDDVNIPANQSWKIQYIGVQGAYANCFPDCTANSFNVMFHLNNGGLPQDPPALTRANQTYFLLDSSCDPLVTSCLFVIQITPPVNVAAAPVPRHGWISVQANMDFGTDGQFFWWERTVQSRDAAAFKNPGDGFVTGCVTWAPMMGCLAGAAPDLMFGLAGTSTP